MAAAFRFPVSGLKADVTPYFAIVDAATGLYPSGYQRLRNPTALTIEPTVEDDAIIGREVENGGQNLDALKNFGDFSFGITMNRVDAYNLALHSAGDITDINVSSGTGTAIAVTIKADSYWVTGFKNLTAATITGLTVTTDFEIFDAAGGVIYIKDTATVVAAEDTEVAGTVDHDAYTGDQISLITNTTIQGKFYAKGKDRVSGRRFELQLDQLSLSADGALDMMNDDRMTVGLSGLIQTPTGAATPGYFRLFAT